MHIQHVEIGNFRKLEAVRIDFSESTTVFVGANNSGKTSAMHALRQFLLDRSRFSLTDITLSQWPKIDAAGRAWEDPELAAQQAPLDWASVLPHLDVWLAVRPEELHHVQSILPSLDWNGEPVGVRLRLEPRDPEALQQEFLKARTEAMKLLAAESGARSTEHGPEEDPSGTNFSLWPKSATKFLSRRMAALTVRSYILDPSKLKTPSNGIARPQTLPNDSVAVEGDRLNRLIRIDEIRAQRGFGTTIASSTSDPGPSTGNPKHAQRLSRQLRDYYSRHLDPDTQPTADDIEALRQLYKAELNFSQRMQNSFSTPFNELMSVGYPGLTDPRIHISTKIKPIDGLDHDSAVQYQVPTQNAGGEAENYPLPETSNGLGYQNLLSLMFSLMSFRDEWMQVGKASARPEGQENEPIPPLHLVLLEEPEAHIHAQVQQVFVQQAFRVLRSHDSLRESADLRTQLIVSTHSSHIAHEADFAALRYFRRDAIKEAAGSVPVATVVNLSEIFGGSNPTSLFATRYLKATHCDLFFADGAILVEGPAERILIPHAIRTCDTLEHLRSRYITLLEIGGSHAHRLRPLIEHIGLPTLIITDLARIAHQCAGPR